MARSEAEICNLALQRVGSTIGIERLDQRSAEAIVCNAVYETVRDRVLSAAPWPFARRIELLNLSGNSAQTWLYRYTYPANCAAVRKIFPQLESGDDPAVLRRRIAESRIPYEIIGDENDNPTICTDLPNAAVEFTAIVTNPTRYDAKFTSAFAWALAGEIALPLAKGVDYSKNALFMYDREINEALAKALNEEKKQDDPESEFVRARE